MVCTRKCQCAVVSAVFLAVVCGAYYMLWYDRNFNPCGSTSLKEVTNPKTGEKWCVCNRQKNTDNPMIFYPGSKLGPEKKDECYPIYTKGPCQQDQWLALNKNGSTVICRKNKCLDMFEASSTDGVNKTDERPVVPWNGTCHHVGDKCEVNTPGDGQILFDTSGSGNTTCKLDTGESNASFQTGSGGKCKDDIVQVGGVCVEFAEALVDYDYY